MIFYNTKGYSIYYEVLNAEQKNTPIIFLNGLSQSTIAWALCLPFFKNRPVILMDFIFQGQSQKNISQHLSFNEHANDVKELLDHLSIKQLHVAGISYGSLVAQHFAVNFPKYLNKLILISSFAHKTPFYEAIELSWNRALETGGYGLLLDVMLPYVLSESYFNNPLIPIDIMKKGRSDINNDAEALMKLMQATKERGDFRKELQKITAPTLVIHGEFDLLFPEHLGQEVADNISNAQFIIIKKAGHTLNLEAASSLCEQINTFLK
ncbi:MAG: alpha/beta hydrolase [Bacteroidia bacterium]|nr:alpha/beta hydrolase [Bacteroidia bacterium]